jgi:4-amino-4-deoxy-L-arabinose transferase-like glycosyltransferase
MNRSILHQLLIVAIASATYFTALGSTNLWDEDEGFFATAAAEMHRRNDWIVPTFNEELFSHKPPLMFWMMRAGYAMFGVNELGSRFGSAVFGVLTALLVYHLGRILFSPRAGLWSGLSFATGLMWTVVSRAATADAYLAFFISASLLVYVRSVFGSGLIRREIDHWHESTTAPPMSAIQQTLDRWLPGRWFTFAGIYVLMSLAVLVKGPIGMLLPGVTIALFVLTQMPIESLEGKSRLRGLFARLKPFIGKPLLATFWAMRPITAIAILLVVAGPWFYLVDKATNGAFLREFFGVHNFGRFMKPMENHRGPIIYYLPVIAIGFFPWSMFAMPTLANAWRRATGGDEKQRFQFVAIWAAVVVGFFSIASTKLPNYVLPAYPAIGLLCGAWLESWLSKREITWSRWPAMAFSTLSAVGIAMLIVLPILGLVSIKGRPLTTSIGVNSALAPALVRTAWIGILPAMGGLLAWQLARRDRRPAALYVTAATSTGFTMAILILAAGWMNAYQTSDPLTAAVHQRLQHGAEVAAFRHSPPSLIFYAADRVERMKTVDEACRFLVGGPSRFLITTDAGYAELEKSGLAPLEILCERPRFPRSGNVMVVAGTARTALRATDDSVRR